MGGEIGAPQGGRWVDLVLIGSEAKASLFQRFESVVLDPFLSASRKEPFFSEGLLIVGLSDFNLLLAGAFPIKDLWLDIVSDPLIDDAALIGFLERFWFAPCSLDKKLPEFVGSFSPGGEIVVSNLGTILDFL